MNCEALNNLLQICHRLSSSEAISHRALFSIPNEKNQKSIVQAITPYSISNQTTSRIANINGPVEAGLYGAAGAGARASISPLLAS